MFTILKSDTKLNSMAKYRTELCFYMLLPIKIVLILQSFVSISLIRFLPPNTNSLFILIRRKIVFAFIFSGTSPEQYSHTKTLVPIWMCTFVCVNVQMHLCCSMFQLFHFLGIEYWDKVNCKLLLGHNTAAASRVNNENQFTIRNPVFCVFVFTWVRNYILCSKERGC